VWNVDGFEQVQNQVAGLKKMNKTRSPYVALPEDENMVIEQVSNYIKLQLSYSDLLHIYVFLLLSENTNLAFM
jgi:hypothetical protein